MAAPMALVIVLIRRKRASTWCRRSAPRRSCARDRLAFAAPFRSMPKSSGCWRCSASASSAWACCCWRFGTPLVSATRGALLGVLQTPLATLWVWLAFAEQPAVVDHARRRDRAGGGGGRHDAPAHGRCRGFFSAREGVLSWERATPVAHLCRPERSEGPHGLSTSTPLAIAMRILRCAARMGGRGSALPAT